MKEYIEERCVEIANYIVNTRCTVRAAANHFRLSKSTIHKDVTARLQQINADLYYKCGDVLSYNKSMRHIRGGQATADRYKRMNHR